MEVWKASEDVMATVEDLVAKYHPHLATIVNQIAVVFREKAGKAGEAVVIGKSKKAPSLLGILGDVDYKFVIEVAADEWTRLADGERVALLDHHLCSCRGVENESTGEMKFFLQPPDVAFYREEVERHGFWRSSGKVPDENIIMDLFGPDQATVQAAAAQAAPPPTKRKKP
jgi:hypothetical protein